MPRLELDETDNADVSMTEREIIAAIGVIGAHLGCNTHICKDVMGDNCECGKIVRRMVKEMERARALTARETNKWGIYRTQPVILPHPD
jgi:hypothetical protein